MNRRNGYATLSEMKLSIFGITEDVIRDPMEHIGTMTRRVMLAGNNLRGVEADILKFHILCVIGNIDALAYFIDSFRSEHGQRALEFLLNSHLPVGLQVRGCGGFFMTPILCASLWNNSRDIIRLLYANGASLHLADCDGRYPEEKLSSIPYFDHLISGSYDPNNNRTVYRRDMSEFSDALSEIRYIVGEEAPPASWPMPTRLIASG